jgi:hypothetical protein
VNVDTIIPPGLYIYPFIAYISDNSEVSSESFTVYGKGYIRDYTDYIHSPYRVAVFGKLGFDLFPYDRDVPAGTVYIRIYPLAHGQGYLVNEFYKEALGKPSNIISFDWYKVTGNK